MGWGFYSFKDNPIDEVCVTIFAENTRITAGSGRHRAVPQYRALARTADQHSRSAAAARGATLQQPLHSRALFGRPFGHHLARKPREHAAGTAANAAARSAYAR